MITIALDENGDFENLKQERDKNPLFIAGILYDDKGDAQDQKNERVRLDEYFRRVCQSVGQQYPYDLHVNKYDNSSAVGKVKEAVNASLPEFFASATFQGKALYKCPRRGQYTIFLNLKSRKGKQLLLEKDTSKVVLDSYASNLYVHMAEELMSRLVFHNPYKSDMESLYLELPTRMVVLDTSNTKKIEEYRSLGYKDYRFQNAVTPDPHKKYLQIANEHNYLMSLNREIIHLDKTKLSLDRLKVNSIYYQAQNKSTTQKNAFLYLADSVCSYLARQVKGGGNPSSWIEDFYDLSQQLNGSTKNILFAYDDIDTCFMQAWKAYEQGYFFDALCSLYEVRTSASEMADFYRIHWVPLLEDALMASQNIDCVEDCIRQYSRYSYSNSYKQDLLRYIYMMLKESVQNLEGLSTWNKEYSYDFYDTGFTTFNHLGDFSKALACFEKCQELRDYTSIEKHTKTLNKAVVAYIDHHLYDTAKAVSSDIIACEKELLVVRELLPFMGEDKATRSKSYGQSLSQMGQVCAYLQDEEGEAYFLEALQEFEPDSVDYYITLSYLLHFYIMQKDQVNYEVWAPKYFGGFDQLSDQWQYIMSLDGDNAKKLAVKFAIFVYMKALYTFYKDTAPNALKERCIYIKKELKKFHKEGEHNGHPWELIYKYIYLLCEGSKYKVYKQDVLEEMKTIVENPGLAIQHIIDYALLKFNPSVTDEDRVALQISLRDLGKAKETQMIKETDRQRLETGKLDDIFVYMFV